jgi:hypothetical protein
MQKIKEYKDKLEAVGVFIEAEEMLYIVLDGLPTEFYPFCSAMRTRNDSISFEELHVLIHLTRTLNLLKIHYTWQWWDKTLKVLQVTLL